MRDHDAEPALEEWTRAIKARGLQGAVGLALDVLEPLGPLGAQLVWVMQPVLGIWVKPAMLRTLADALEMPGGLDRLRQQLDDEQDAGQRG